jgi:hypothetical protein
MDKDVLESQLYRRCVREGVKLIDGRYICDQEEWATVKNKKTTYCLGDKIGCATLHAIDVQASGKLQRSTGTVARRTLMYILKCDFCGNISAHSSMHIHKVTGCLQCSDVLLHNNIPIDIYMMYAPYCNLYKVGISLNATGRLRSVNEGSPTPINLYYVRHGLKRQDAKQLENQLHQLLNKYHHYREWYQLPDKYVPAIVNIIKFAYGKVGPE